MKQKKREVPRLADRLLRVILNQEDYKERSGDFEEVHGSVLERHGSIRAYMWYWIQF